jgi:hypothetical protein
MNMGLSVLQEEALPTILPHVPPEMKLQFQGKQHVNVPPQHLVLLWPWQPQLLC